jgi:hypothetical protein
LGILLVDLGRGKLTFYKYVCVVLKPDTKPRGFEPIFQEMFLV